VAVDSAGFVSEASADAPRYRLTYVRAGSDELNLKFEIAPPGKPDAFKNISRRETAAGGAIDGPGGHSYRSARIGSMRDARRAGM
jgi:hypothetical protein